MMGFPRTPVQLANQPPQPLNQRPLAAIQDVTPGYFHTLEVPLKRGREFSERDHAAAPLTAIVNESLARALWPAYPSGLDPVGQRILIGVKPNPVEIVGIVADVHQVLETDPCRQCSAHSTSILWCPPRSRCGPPAILCNSSTPFGSRCWLSIAISLSPRSKPWTI